MSRPKSMPFLHSQAKPSVHTLSSVLVSCLDLNAPLLLIARVVRARVRSRHAFERRRQSRRRRDERSSLRARVLELRVCCTAE